MSYSTLYVFFDDGEAVAFKEFKNGFGSAPRVWNSMSEKYGRVLHPEPERLPFVMDLWTEMWGIEKKLTIPWWEHNLLHWTFDNALIKAEDIPLFIESLRRYDKEYANDKSVSHLVDLASALEALYAETSSKLLAIGHQHTSASQEQWQVYDPQIEGDVPYNMLKGTKHWFIEMLSENTPQVTDDPKGVEDLAAKDGPAVPPA